MKPAPQATWWTLAVPFLFVLLWSTGFIGSKLGVLYAEPFTFLTLRFCIVLGVLIPIALVSRAPWPQGWRQLAHLAFAGLLIQALYLSGCVWSLRLGLPSGILSLVVSMQPLFTAAFAGLTLGERVLPRQWGGLALGFLGTAMVVAHKTGSGLKVQMMAPAVASLIGITVGTLWQKRHCPAFDLRTGAIVQYGASLAATAVLAGEIRPRFETDLGFRIAGLIGEERPSVDEPDARVTLDGLGDKRVERLDLLGRPLLVGGARKDLANDDRGPRVL
jgi:drug/metabolite transporter (DMT)-like permease